jgi:putative RNA 2'-phosphotransferase
MSTRKIDLQQLSRTLSQALRHEPWLYELEIEEEGWISIDLLLAALRQEQGEWSNLNEANLIDIISSSSKKRHEIRNGKIRALYGHSLPGKLSKRLAEPPKVLYHGTSPSATESIRTEGLKPMNRQYVHLSVDIETAKQVGQRKTKRPMILEVRSYAGYQAGMKFYQGNDCVWLADYVLPDFINFPATELRESAS